MIARIFVPTFVFSALLAALAPHPLRGQAFPAPGERHRDWTSEQGTVFRSRLIAVNETTVKLASKGVIRQVPIALLSEEYREVARSLMPELGRISTRRVLRWRDSAPRSGSRKTAAQSGTEISGLSRTGGTPRIPRSVRGFSCGNTASWAGAFG